MTKRQSVFAGLCFLFGLLVGIEIAGHLDALVIFVIIVALLLLGGYLILPYLRQRTPHRRSSAPRLSQKRPYKKP